MPSAGAVPRSAGATDRYERLRQAVLADRKAWAGQPGGVAALVLADPHPGPPPPGRSLRAPSAPVAVAPPVRAGTRSAAAPPPATAPGQAPSIISVLPATGGAGTPISQSGASSPT